MKQSKIAKQIAAKAHEGQFRRDGKTPYVNHVLAVSQAIKNMGLNDDLVAIALLHDCCEEAGVTAQDLLNQGIKQNVVDSVMAISKLEGEPLENYWTRVFNNSDALVVKIFDIQNNLSDAPTEKQKLKYGRALDFFKSLDKNETVGRKLNSLIFSKKRHGPD
jgi:(p)ppGpp synthase/HD superfamily hydrolase